MQEKCEQEHSGYGNKSRGINSFGETICAQLAVDRLGHNECTLNIVCVVLFSKQNLVGTLPLHGPLPASRITKEDNSISWIFWNTYAFKVALCSNLPTDAAIILDHQIDEISQSKSTHFWHWYLCRRSTHRHVSWIEFLSMLWTVVEHHGRHVMVSFFITFINSHCTPSELNQKRTNKCAK